MKSTLVRGRPLLLCACLAFASVATAQDATPSSTGTKPSYDELARKVEKHADHTVTFIRVRPPKLPKAPPPATQPAPTADELATAARREGKSYETIAVTANVYVGKSTLTELSWQDESGATYHALSNVDFRLLTQLTDVETKDAVYLWFPFVAAAEGEVPDSVSASDLKKLNPKQADYLFLGSPQEQKAAASGLDLLDYIHAYAQLNEAKLKRDLAQREADEIAAEEKRKRTPPPSPTIYYWLETGGKR